MFRDDLRDGIGDYAGGQDLGGLKFGDDFLDSHLDSKCGKWGLYFTI